MTAAMRAMTGRRPAMWLALLLVALLGRAAVPAGWMLDLSPTGRLTVTLCDGMAPTAPMAMPGGHGHHAPAERAPDHPCAFAGMAMAAALPDLAPLAPMPPVASPVALTSPRAVAIGRGLAAPPPPPTGPPSLA